MEDQARNTIDGFMCEEYKNIASSHDNMREMVGRTFNYFLLISAFPFTAYTFSKAESNPSITWLLPLLFLVVSLGDICMALAMLEARLSQYRYARAVNLIRKYHSDLSPDLKQYLHFPTSGDVPEYSFSALGFVKYEIVFMGIISLSYFCLGLWQFGVQRCYISNAVIVLALVSIYLGARIIARFTSKHSTLTETNKKV